MRFLPRLHGIEVTYKIRGLVPPYFIVRTGSKKARVAAARHLLRIIYCMLKDQRNYRP